MSHYTQFVESDAAPESFTLVVSDQQIEQMNADMLDVIRNNESLAESELVLLAAQQEREAAAALAIASTPLPAAPAKPAAADRDECRVSVYGRDRYQAFAKLAGGRWVRGGYFSYKSEAAAWNAARTKLVELQRAALKPRR